MWQKYLILLKHKKFEKMSLWISIVFHKDYIVFLSKTLLDFQDAIILFLLSKRNILFKPTYFCNFRIKFKTIFFSYFVYYNLFYVHIFIELFGTVQIVGLGFCTILRNIRWKKSFPFRRVYERRFPDVCVFCVYSVYLSCCAVELKWIKSYISYSSKSI